MATIEKRRTLPKSSRRSSNTSGPNYRRYPVAGTGAKATMCGIQMAIATRLSFPCWGEQPAGAVPRAVVSKRADQVGRWTMCPTPVHRGARRWASSVGDGALRAGLLLQSGTRRMRPRSRWLDSTPSGALQDHHVRGWLSRPPSSVPLTRRQAQVSRGLGPLMAGFV